MFKARLLVVAIAVLPTLLLAYSSGPPLGVTGAFGQPNCTDCHFGNPLNASGGTFTISGVPANYTPGGPAIPITVTISKSGQRRWGFELAVRASSNGAQAGSMTNLGNSTQIGQQSGIQYIEHTSIGTQFGAAQGTWTFNWTPPATAVGEIDFTAAGNAANGDSSTTGDFIYTTLVATQPQAQVTSPLPNKPTLTIIPHFVAGGTADGGFVSRIFINNLSATTQNGVIVNIINQNGQVATAGQEQILPPSGSLQLSTGEGNRFTNQTTQWVAIGSDLPISATVLFDFRFATSAANETVSAVGVLASNPSRNFKAPYLFQQQTSTLPVLTEGLALANRSADTNTVSIQLLDTTGAVMASDTLTIQGFNQTAFDPFFTSPSPTPTIRNFLANQPTFFGSLVISATQDVAPVYVGNIGGRLFSLSLTAQ